MNDSASIPSPLPTLAILGSGSMGSAILAGLVRAKAPRVRVTNRTAAKAAGLAQLPGVISLSLEETPDANLRAVDGAALVIVAVKPAIVPDLLREVGPALAPGTIVVSVAAGVSCSTFEELLPTTIPVVRSMPNTPAVVGLGVTGLAAGSRSTAADLALARRVFETVGDVVEVPETQIDAVTSISGSGPAYVFYLIEQLTQTAIDKGFTREQADLLVQGTFRGASELLATSPDGPEVLRARVTSPKGTTERAIAVLEDADLKSVFDRATDAALARAKELAAGA